MRKQWISILIVGLLAFGLMACSGPGEGKSAQEKDAAPEKKTVGDVGKPGKELYNNGDIRVSVSDVVYNEETQGFELEVNVDNQSGKDIYVSFADMDGTGSLHYGLMGILNGYEVNQKSYFPMERGLGEMSGRMREDILLDIRELTYTGNMGNDVLIDSVSVGIEEFL